MTTTEENFQCFQGSHGQQAPDPSQHMTQLVKRYWEPAKEGLGEADFYLPALFKYLIYVLLLILGGAMD